MLAASVGIVTATNLFTVSPDRWCGFTLNREITSLDCACVESFRRARRGARPRAANPELWTEMDVPPCNPQRMDVEDAIRTRRTHKAFGHEPLERETLDELFELARWAPNHHGTSPWRFRVLGAGARERLKRAAGPEQAAKLDRAPTLIVVSA